jgi:hypothetical protein
MSRSSSAWSIGWPACVRMTSARDVRVHRLLRREADLVDRADVGDPGPLPARPARPRIRPRRPRTWRACPAARFAADSPRGTVARQVVEVGGGRSRRAAGQDEDVGRLQERERGLTFCVGQDVDSYCPVTPSTDFSSSGLSSGVPRLTRDHDLGAHVVRDVDRQVVGEARRRPAGGPRAAPGRWPGHRTCSPAWPPASSPCVRTTACRSPRSVATARNGMGSWSKRWKPRTLLSLRSTSRAARPRRGPWAAGPL